MRAFKPFMSATLAAVVMLTGVTSPAQAGAPPPIKLAITSVTAETTQSLTTAVDTLIALDRARMSFGGYVLATSPSRVSVPTDGAYDLRGVVEFASNGTGRRTLKIVSVDAAGSVLKTHETRTIDASSGGTTQVVLSTKAFLLAGEIVGIVANQTSGGALSTVAGGKLSVTREVLADANSIVVPGPIAARARFLLAKYQAAQLVAYMTSPPTKTVGGAAAASTLSGNAATAPTYLATLPNTATFTASIPAVATSTASSISGTTLTVGGTVTGAFAIGQTISGTGATAGTVILAGSGSTWTVSATQTVASTAIKALGDVMTTSAFTSGAGTLIPGSGLSGGGVLSNTAIVSQLSGAAGNVGTYRVSVVQDVTSGAMTAGTPNPVFVNRGGARSGGTSAAGQYTTTANAGAPQQANNGWGARFTVTGTAFDYCVGSFNSGNGVRSKINGQWADTAKSVIPDTSNVFCIKEAFAAGAGTYTVDLYFDKDVYFRGGNVSPGGSITAAPFPAGSITALFVGDSYTGGAIGGGVSSVSESTGSIRMGDSIPYKVAETVGWENPVTLGNGGTGYLIDGTTRRIIHRSRDVPRFAPDAIVMEAGINDWLQSVSAPNITTAQTAAILEYRAQAPNALLIVVGARRGSGNPTSQAFWDAQKAGFVAANDNNACYLDPSSTGGNWQNAANDSTWMGADATHPTPVGEAGIGVKEGQAIGACLTALAASSN